MNNTIALSKKDELIQNVKRWVIIDKQLKIINEKTRELRQLKNTCGEGICTYLSDNPNLNNVIGITDGELRLYQKRDYSPVTFGYIEKCLGEIIPNKTQVDYIIKYLKEHREITTNDDIKFIPAKI